VATTRASRGWPLRSTTLITMLVVMVAIACLWLARAFVVPIAMAVLLAFVLSPVVSLLDRRRLPRVVSVFAVVAILGLLLATGGWIVTSQIVEFLNELPQYQDNITRRIENLRAQSRNSLVTKVEGFVEKVSAAATGAAEATTASHQEPPQPVRVINTQGIVQVGPLISSAGELFEILASAGLVAVLVIFMLINREDIRNRMLRLFGEGRMTLTTRALDDAAQGLSRYLLAQFGLNAAFGIVVAAGVWLIGVPYPLLWGVCATVLRYIPYFGPWIAASLPLTLSLAIHPGWTQPLLIFGLFLSFELFAGFVAEPLLYGQSMGVSPSALLIAIAFWSWLWGAMGLVLAVPLTACLVVLGKHVEQLRFFSVLLGDEPVLTADINFYQRLLARDQDEASDIAHERLRALSLEDLYDEIFIPAIVFVRRDYDANLLSEEEISSILEMTREIAEECWSTSIERAAKAVDEEQIPERAKLSILACAARDAADETALDMFARLLDPNVCDTHVVSTDRLVSEIVELVAEERPSIVCIASLPPGGLSHTRLICKRLRGRFPNLKIVVARWGLKSNVDRNREQLAQAGADHFGTTLRDTSTQLVQLAHLARPAVETVNAERQDVERRDQPKRSLSGMH